MVVHFYAMVSVAAIVLWKWLGTELELEHEQTRDFDLYQGYKR